MSDTNIWDMADAWNNAANIFTAIKMNVTDTASQAASLLMDLQVNGVSKFSVSKSGGIVSSASYQVGGSNYGASVSIAGVLQFGTNVLLAADAAGAFAQRNGVNAQTFRVYNTYTDASNYERGVTQWNSNVFEIGSEAAGTGSARAIRLKAAGVNSLLLNTNSADRWSVTGAGNFTAQTDNTYDIGASGANRPRTLYLANALFAGGNIGITGAAAVIDTSLSIAAGGTGRSQLRLAAGVAPSAPVNGDIWFDGTNIKMQIGGATKTFTLT